MAKKKTKAIVPEAIPDITPPPATPPPRWGLVEMAMYDIKDYFNQKKLTYNERFVIMDLLTKEIDKDYYSNVMSLWFQMYMDEQKQNINITHRHSYIQ